MSGAAKEELAEAATVASLVRVMHEQNQFTNRLMLGYEGAHRRVADLCDMLTAQLKNANEITTRALDQQVRLAELQEDLLSQRHQRELAAKAAANKEQAFAELARDARVIIPLALKRLVGIPITGNDSHGLQDFLATMTPEQQENLFSKGELKLSVAQLQLLTSVLTSFAAQEAKKAEESKKAEPEKKDKDGFVELANSEVEGAA